MVRDGRIRLKYLTRAFRDQLESCDLGMVSDGHGNPAVEFGSKEGESLDSVLVELAKAGAAFQSDPKDIASPASLMYQLRENGVYEGFYIVCFFDGQRWNYTDRYKISVNQSIHLTATLASLQLEEK